MLDAFLAFFFQITMPTPQKYAWLILAIINIALMLVLAWRSWRSWFSVYLVVAATASLLQASPLWGWPGEAALAALAALWVASILPRGRADRVLAIAVGAILLGALIGVIPMAWPKYSAVNFYIRLYSTAMFCAVSLACAVDPWTRGERMPMRAAIAVPWFLTTLLSGVPWDAAYWDIAVAAKAAWMCCLMAWLSTDPATRKAIDVSPQAT